MDARQAWRSICKSAKMLHFKTFGGFHVLFCCYLVLVVLFSIAFWVQAPKPSSGPHKSRECLPLILILRNRLKYALTYREVIAILMQRHVLVDGKVRTDKTYPSGFMGKSVHSCNCMVLIYSFIEKLLQSVRRWIHFSCLMYNGLGSLIMPTKCFNHIA